MAREFGRRSHYVHVADDGGDVAQPHDQRSWTAGRAGRDAQRLPQSFEPPARYAYRALVAISHELIPMADDDPILLDFRSRAQNPSPDDDDEEWNVFDEVFSHPAALDLMKFGLAVDEILRGGAMGRHDDYLWRTAAEKLCDEPFVSYLAPAQLTMLIQQISPLDAAGVDRRTIEGLGRLSREDLVSLSVDALDLLRSAQADGHGVLNVADF